NAQADAAGGTGDEGAFSFEHGISCGSSSRTGIMIRRGTHMTLTTQTPDAALTEPRLNTVQCLDARGLHRMAYWEWGEPTNPHVVVCVHGLTRQGRDFDSLARELSASHRVVC
ncbi:hypothetical protein RZS08_02660, partial [Arthrospira platensis SPKY1]|nr:hypothetical protein [Arthrospira platensis SPKY1]